MQQLKVLLVLVSILSQLRKFHMMICPLVANNYQANPSQLVDKLITLNLTTAEMTALIGGLRVLNAAATDNKIGDLTNDNEIVM